MARGSVSREQYPGLDFEFELFKDTKILPRRVVNSTGNTHVHDYPQMYCCFEGESRHHISGKEYVIREGDVIFMPAGSFHRFGLSDDCKLVNVNLSFKVLFKKNCALSLSGIAHMFLHNFGEELGFSVPIVVKLAEESMSEAWKIFDEMIEKNHSKDVRTEDQIALLNKLFSFPEFSFDAARERTVRTVAYDKLIPAFRAVEYMNEKFSEKIHCEDLLRVSGFCRTDFYKMIKKTVGETYSIYLQKIRVKRAHRALGFSDYSFSYISDMCGFGSPTYFGKCYKKYRGYTPKEERAALKELQQTYPHIRVSHEYFRTDEKRNDK